MSTKTKKPAKKNPAKKRKSKPAKKAPEALLESVNFKSEHRVFAKGRKLSFQPGVNLIVGDQGAGKSSLLEAIAQCCSARESERDKARKIMKLELSDPPTPLLSFDFEKDSPRTKSYFEEGATQMMFQVQSHFSSHGETVLALLEDLMRTIEKKKEPFILLLDEPDMALSPRSARRLGELLGKIAGGGSQVIAAVHNPIVISSQERVLSLEHKRWMRSETFLAKHLED